MQQARLLRHHATVPQRRLSIELVITTWCIHISDGNNLDLRSSLSD